MKRLQTWNCASHAQVHLLEYSFTFSQNAAATLFGCGTYPSDTSVLILPLYFISEKTVE